ncbi:signal peptidase I [Kitasatospora sp. NBC_00458]|uniref:signal peptidase I n=1 Tax=Kitasatospora sp. NBC_00458 TaxID=2903568 RepID=UPI002E17A9F3
MSTHEPPADRDGCPAPTGADSPTRSAVVSAGDPGTAAADGAAVEAPAAGPAGAVGPARAVGPVEGAKQAAEGAEDADGGDGTEGGEGGDTKDAEDPEEPSRSRSRDLLLLAGTCLFVLLVVNAFVARPFSVPSGSMENSLRPGDRLIVNQLSYAFGGHPRRGDVVVFDGTGSFLRKPFERGGIWSGLRSFGRDVGLVPAGDSVYVKRVIGVGGDRVTSAGPGHPITVNGVPVDESAYLSPGDEPSGVAFDIVVPAGKLWVMGDHRSASRDSRDHLGDPGGGFVPEDKVIGRAAWVVYPIGHWSSLDRPAAFAATGGTGGHGDQR